MGQYRVTLVTTGDDLGPDALVWLVEHQVATLGHIVYVEHIARIGKDRRAPTVDLERLTHAEQAVDRARKLIEANDSPDDYAVTEAIGALRRAVASFDRHHPREA
jgi:hypothetical protein